MPDQPKVLVCGGRDLDDRAAVYAKFPRVGMQGSKRRLGTPAR
jgi:hypothetical protein